MCTCCGEAGGPAGVEDQAAVTGDDRLAELITVRDWLRHAVTRFNAAGLAYGHGTASALDEAAFLILETLHLPIDQLEPWLDARLATPERVQVRDIIEARIAGRKPASYLTGTAYIRGRRFAVDERTIVPRSYIGELLSDLIDEPEAEPSPLGLAGAPVASVLDLCTGGGSLAILAALAFPHARIDAVDISKDALEVAQRNVADYGLAGRIKLAQSDLFGALAGRSFDLILSNPPYVSDESLAAFPPEHRAEPKLAHAGGADGLDIVRRILSEAGRYLDPAGTLVVEIGQARDALVAAYPGLPFLWLDTAESEGEVFALPASALLPKPPRRKTKPA